MDELVERFSSLWLTQPGARPRAKCQRPPRSRACTRWRPGAARRTSRSFGAPRTWASGRYLGLPDPVTPSPRHPESPRVTQSHPVTPSGPGGAGATERGPITQKSFVDPGFPSRLRLALTTQNKKLNDPTWAPLGQRPKRIHFRPSRILGARALSGSAGDGHASGHLGRCGHVELVQVPRQGASLHGKFGKI